MRLHPTDIDVTTPLPALAGVEGISALLGGRPGAQRARIDEGGGSVKRPAPGAAKPAQARTTNAPTPAKASSSATRQASAGAGKGRNQPAAAAAKQLTDAQEMAQLKRASQRAQARASAKAATDAAASEARRDAARASRSKAAPRASAPTPKPAAAKGAAGAPARELSLSQEKSIMRDVQRRAAAKRTSAAALDQRVADPAAKQAQLAAQARLQQAEAAARAAAKPQVVRSTNKMVRDELRESNRTAAAAAKAQITEARAAYAQQHGVWIDADGTAYAAKVDRATGALELERRETRGATKQAPAVTVDREATVHTDNSRQSRVRTSTIPTGAPQETHRVRTEAVDTDPRGKVTGSSITEEQSRTERDGTRLRVSAKETFDASGAARTRSSSSDTRRPSGDSERASRTVHLAKDGTATRIQESEERSGAGGARSTSTRDTHLRPDGVTPKVQYATDTSGQGATSRTAHARTLFGETGVPTERFVSRSGARDRGEAPTERMTFDAMGEVTSLTVGGNRATASDLSRTGAPVVSGDAVQGMRGTAVGSIDLSRGPVGNRSAQSWERGAAGTNRFGATGAADGLLAPALGPSVHVPSAFDVPAALRVRASAAELDRTAPKPGSAAFATLERDQIAFQRRFDAAGSDADRSALQAEYFASHDLWIDRGAGGVGAPVAMAAAFTSGVPTSSMFGADRARRPHVVAARTDISGVDVNGQATSTDVLRRTYADATRDDVVRVGTTLAGGGTSISVVGEHRLRSGVVTERDAVTTSRVVRAAQGLDPLVSGVVVRERFGADGKPTSRYEATTSADRRQSSLTERTDAFRNGVLIDTKATSTTQSRDWDQDVVDRFERINTAVLDRAHADDFDPNRHGLSMTSPAVGSFRNHSVTDVDYDAQGRAIHSVTEAVDQTVDPTTDVDEKGAATDDVDGARLTTTTRRIAYGSPTGTVGVIDGQGRPMVAGRIESAVRTSTFDPTDGVAGGNRNAGHQFRQSTELRSAGTLHADGRVELRYSPLVERTLDEGFDDDWSYVEKRFRTDADGNVATVGSGKDRRSDELRAGQSFQDEHGRTVKVDRGSVSTGDLDAVDRVEGFMDQHWSKISTVAGGALIVAGIGLAVFTGGTSLALVAAGAAVASTELAYTAWNYRQGEEGFGKGRLAMAGAGAALSIIPGLGMATGMVGRNADDALRGASLLRRGTTAVVAGMSGNRAQTVANLGMTTASAPALVAGFQDGDITGWDIAGAAVAVGGIASIPANSAAMRSYQRRHPVTSAGSPPVARPTDIAPLAGTRSIALPGVRAGGAAGAPEAPTAVAGARGAAAPNEAVVTSADQLTVRGFSDGPLNADYTQARRTRLAVIDLMQSQRVKLPGSADRTGTLIDRSHDSSRLLVRDDVTSQIIEIDAAAFRAANETSLVGGRSSGALPTTDRTAIVDVPAAALAGRIVPGSVDTLKPWSSGPSGEPVVRQRLELPDGRRIDVVRKTANSGAAQEHVAFELAKLLGVDAYLPATARAANGDAIIEFVEGRVTNEVVAAKAGSVLGAAEANVRARHPELDADAVTARAQTDIELLHQLDFMLGNHDHNAGDHSAFRRNTLIDATGALRVIDFGSSTLTPGEGVPRPALSPAARARLSATVTSEQLAAVFAAAESPLSGGLPQTRAINDRLVSGAFQRATVRELGMALGTELQASGARGDLASVAALLDPAAAAAARATIGRMPAEIGFGKPKQQIQHFVKHRHEFSGAAAIDGVVIDSPDAYLARARSVADKARAGHPDMVFARNEATTNTIVMDRTTGEMLALSADGRIASFHRLGIDKQFSTAKLTLTSGDSRTVKLDAAGRELLIQNMAARLGHDHPHVASMRAKGDDLKIDLGATQRDIQSDPFSLDLRRIRAVERATAAELKGGSAAALDLTSYKVARPTSEFDAHAAMREFVVTSHRTGIPVSPDRVVVRTPAHDPEFVAIAEAARARTGSAAGDLEMGLFGRLTGRGGHAARDLEAAIVSAREQGDAVTVRRSSGEVEGGWRISSRADGSEVARRVLDDGSFLERPLVRDADFFRLNPHQLVGAAALVRRSSGATDTDWVISGYEPTSGAVIASHAAAGYKVLGVDQALVAVQGARDAAAGAAMNGAALRQSLRFSQQHELSGAEPIADGYVDGGRLMMLDGNGTRGATNREVIVVDRTRDANLREHLAVARNLQALPEATRAQAIARYVEDAMGGRPTDADLDTNSGLARTHAGSEMLIGNARAQLGGVGVCRHRSILYKLMADEAGLSSRIRRGDAYYEGSDPGAHAWNEVMVDGKPVIVDVMNPVGRAADGGLEFMSSVSHPATQSVYRNFAGQRIYGEGAA